MKSLGVTSINDRACRCFNKMKSKKVMQKPNAIKRPHNAFILYRIENLQVLREKFMNMKQMILRNALDNEIPTELADDLTFSKIVSLSWRDEPESVKQHFHVLSFMARLEHEIEYPEYYIKKPKEQKLKLKEEDNNERKKVTKNTLMAEIGIDGQDLLAMFCFPSPYPTPAPEVALLTSDDGEMGDDGEMNLILEPDGLRHDLFDANLFNFNF